jgi:hypothetical protein
VSFFIDPYNEQNPIIWDTAAGFTSSNRTLLAGQIGVELDTRRLKIGDGTTTWTSLSYFGAGRVTSTASSTTPTPDIDSTDIFILTALAAGATFGAPTGTPSQGQKLIVRIKDNGTARSLAFNAIYRFSSDLAAPTTTVVNKTMYLGFIYNSTDAKWDCVAKLDNF